MPQLITGRAHCIAYSDTAAPCMQRNDGGSDADAIDSDKIARLATDFKRRANMLYTLLQSNKLQGSQRAPFLRQFLLRLNFNSWQEREAVRQLRGPAMT